MALRLSLEVSLAAAGLSLLFGAPVAWVLARSSIPGRSVLRAVVILPLVLPPVVGGVGLLAALGRSGVVGRWLDAVGIQLTFTVWGAIVATTFVSIPLVILATEAGLRSLDPRLEAPRPPWAPPGAMSFVVSRSRSSARSSRRASCWPGPARSGSSARRSPLPATWPAHADAAARGLSGATDGPRRGDLAVADPRGLSLVVLVAMRDRIFAR